MTKITDTIKIQVEMSAPEALRSMIVLGRTNGKGSGNVWKAIRDQLDPKRLFSSIGTSADSHLGIIDYSSIEGEMNKHFFDLYEEESKNTKLAEIVILEDKMLEMARNILKLKREIGE